MNHKLKVSKIPISIILFLIVHISYSQELKIKFRIIPLAGIFYENAIGLEYQFNHRLAANIAYQFHWEVGEGTSYKHRRLYFSGRIYSNSENYMTNKLYVEPFYRYSNTYVTYEMHNPETFIFHSPGISLGKQFEFGKRWLIDFSIGGFLLNDKNWNKDISDFTIIHQKGGPIFWRFDFKVV